MGYIVLNTVTFDRVVSTPKQATVKYKLSTDPDSSFITKTTAADIQPTLTPSTTGNFSPVLVIDGLINGQAYTVETTLNCSGVGVRFTTNAGVPVTTTTTTTLAIDPYNVGYYSANSGVISGTCGLDGSYVERTQEAADASQVAGATVTVTVNWSADNGCSVTGVEYVFAPGATTSSYQSVNLACGAQACSGAEGTVVSAV